MDKTARFIADGRLGQRTRPLDIGAPLLLAPAAELIGDVEDKIAILTRADERLGAFEIGLDDLGPRRGPANTLRTARGCDPNPDAALREHLDKTPADEAAAAGHKRPLLRRHGSDPHPVVPRRL